MIEYCVWDKEKQQTWFLDVIFESRTEAENVLLSLMEKANNDEKSRASMHDYFSLCGIHDPHEELTQYLKWQYSVIAKTPIVRKVDGYILELPKMVMIDID